MKKILVLPVVVVSLLFILPGCKKGENDPFLSLRSRKVRLSGEYAISSWKSTNSSTDTDGDIEVTTMDVTGTSGTVVTTVTPLGEEAVSFTQNIVFDQGEFIINKDGTWESTINTTTTFTLGGDGVVVESTSYTIVATNTESGTWSFLGGEPEKFENKERVLFSVINSMNSSQTTIVTLLPDGSSTTDVGDLESTSATNAEGAISTIYEIDGLKKKEMTLKQDNSSSESNTETVGAISITFSVVNTGDLEIKLIEE